MRRAATIGGALLAAAILLAGDARAQLAPGVGYVHPCGGRAGTTVEVRLGLFDAVPDVQIVPHDPRVKIELAGPPTPVLVPDPPYWFGPKARGPALPQPREFPARIVLPKDLPAGIVRWQVATASGASDVGWFVVSHGDEAVEDALPTEETVAPGGRRSVARRLSGIPVAVSGRLLLIEEVDRYRFVAPKTGPVTCRLAGPGLGAGFQAVLQVFDATGRRLADVADPAAGDAVVTFAAEQGKSYEVALHDIDFVGDRAFVYRLEIATGPRVLAALPAGGKRGATTEIEFVGVGLETGQDRIERVRRAVAVPAAAPGSTATTFDYVLSTPHGEALPFALRAGDDVETREPAATDLAQRRLKLPAAVTGTIEERFGSDRFLFDAAEGDVLRILVEATSAENRLDPSVQVLNEDGSEVQPAAPAKGKKPVKVSALANDDMPGRTDALVEFAVPAAGTYQVVVGDSSGNSGGPASTYRLSIAPAAPDFELSVPEVLSVTIGKEAPLVVKVVRSGGFDGPIALVASGLPAGVAITGDLTIPAGKADVKLNLTCAADAAAVGALLRFAGTAEIDGKNVERRSGPLLAATVIKPPFAINPEGKDDVRKVPRGTTFPAPLLIEREEGFDGVIVLEMTSRQQRHRQGITGPELPVPPGTTRIEYPIFLPEWLETTKTSRMILNGVAKLKDGQGRERSVVQKMNLRIGMLPEGAVLKIAAAAREVACPAEGPIELPVSIVRLPEVRDPLRLELRTTTEDGAAFVAEPVDVPPGVDRAVFVVRAKEPLGARDAYRVTVRATTTWNKLPAWSETTFDLVVPRTVRTGGATGR